jgi:hypothetical protein
MPDDPVGLCPMDSIAAPKLRNHSGFRSNANTQGMA